jgi:hypothetical protein
MLRASTLSNDLAPSGIARWSIQIRDTYCPRFRVSPTNSIRLPRSISSIRVALKLRHINFSFLSSVRISQSLNNELEINLHTDAIPWRVSKVTEQKTNC